VFWMEGQGFCSLGCKNEIWGNSGGLGAVATRLKHRTRIAERRYSHYNICFTFLMIKYVIPHTDDLCSSCISFVEITYKKIS